MKSYSIKKKRGIDDLLCEFAWVGNSQGDESATNDCNEGLSSEGWMSFVFDGIDRYDQEAVNREAQRRKEENQKYIEQLKANGTFGEEFEVSIHFKHNPIFDSPLTAQVKPESFRLLFIDTETGKIS